jgi:hypothetical protein
MQTKGFVNSLVSSKPQYEPLLITVLLQLSDSTLLVVLAVVPVFDPVLIATNSSLPITRRR